MSESSTRDVFGSDDSTWKELAEREAEVRADLKQNPARLQTALETSVCSPNPSKDPAPEEPSPLQHAEYHSAPERVLCQRRRGTAWTPWSWAEGSHWTRDQAACLNVGSTVREEVRQ